jgi:hypothetical protein
MRHLRPVAALLTVGLVAVLHAPSSGAQQFYTGSASSMFGRIRLRSEHDAERQRDRVSQQGECTIYPGSVVAAVPIEAWVSAQISGLHAQSEKLQRQVDELQARVRALEAAASSGPGSSGACCRPESTG